MKLFIINCSLSHSTYNHAQISTWNVLNMHSYATQFNQFNRDCLFSLILPNLQNRLGCFHYACSLLRLLDIKLCVYLPVWFGYQCTLLLIFIQANARTLISVHSLDIYFKREILHYFRFVDQSLALQNLFNMYLPRKSYLFCFSGVCATSTNNPLAALIGFNTFFFVLSFCFLSVSILTSLRFNFFIFRRPTAWKSNIVRKLALLINFTFLITIKTLTFSAKADATAPPTAFGCSTSVSK